MRWLPPVMTAFDLIPDLASKVSYGQTLPVRDNRLKVCCVGLMMACFVKRVSHQLHPMQMKRHPCLERLRILSVGEQRPWARQCMKLSLRNSLRRRRAIVQRLRTDFRLTPVASDAGDERACHRQVETTNHVRIMSAESSRSAQRAGTSPYEDGRVIWAPTLAPKVGALSFLATCGDCHTPACESVTG
jgi:hypothetical protein